MTKRERERELKRAAYHEAGHAVIAYLKTAKFDFVSIEATGKETGRMGRQFIEYGDFSHEAEACVSLAGLAAEYRYRRRLPLFLLLTDNQSREILDLMQARRSLVSHWAGTGDFDLGPIEVDEEEIQKELRRVYGLVETSLRQNWTAVKAVAEHLLKRGRLSCKEAIIVMKAAFCLGCG